MAETDLPTEIDRLQAELDEIAVAGLTFDDAWRLGGILRELAVERSLGVAIDIRRGQQQVFHTALPGSTANNDDWIARKIATTWKYGTSSLLVRLRSDAHPDARGFWWLDPSVFALSGGCVPLRLADGAVIGTATVSGLADTDDHALVVEGIRRLLG